MNCQVCTEKINKRTHSLVQCKCEYTCCKSCAKTYLLSCSKNPHCMNCKVDWNRDFLVINFDKNFINNTMKKHRENVLYEREIALLPMTQPHVEHRKKIKKKGASIAFLRQLILRMIQTGQNTTEEDQMQMLAYHTELVGLQDEYHDLITKGVDENVAKEFIRQCPNNTCKGFLSKNLYCELCHIHACANCHEIKNTTHICNPDTIETIKSMKNNTKPCPKCATLIFKIQGCDQMYCVQCHTAFSWNTLRIETGTIHNPHYFEWIRQRNNGNVPRNPLDIPCGREIDAMFAAGLDNLLKNYVSATVINRLNDMCLRITHIREVDKPRYYVNPQNTNLELRIKYMMNFIDQPKFKSELQRREKKKEKKTEIYNIIDMFVNCTTDILYNFDDQVRNEYKEFYDTAMTLVKNKEFSSEIKKKIQKTQELKKAWKILEKIVKKNEKKNDVELIVALDTQIIDLRKKMIAKFNQCYITLISEIECLIKYANEQLEKIATIYNCKKLAFTNELLLS